MARNRKSQSAATRFGPALKACLLCLLIGGSGVGYVWQKEQISKLGHLVNAREIYLHTMEEQNEKLRKQLANLRSPKFLETRVKDLGLVQPPLNQILRLEEPVPETNRMVATQRYATRSDRDLLQP
jgi:hypothetical protein